MARPAPRARGRTGRGAAPPRRSIGKVIGEVAGSNIVRRSVFFLGLAVLTGLVYLFSSSPRGRSIVDTGRRYGWAGISFTSQQVEKQVHAQVITFLETATPTTTPTETPTEAPTAVVTPVPTSTAVPTRAP